MAWKVRPERQNSLAKERGYGSYIGSVIHQLLTEYALATICQRAKNEAILVER
jgi:hypothetical protein